MGWRQTAVLQLMFEEDIESLDWFLANEMPAHSRFEDGQSLLEFCIAHERVASLRTVLGRGALNRIFAEGTRSLTELCTTLARVDNLSCLHALHAHCASGRFEHRLVPHLIAECAREDARRCLNWLLTGAPQPQRVREQASEILAKLALGGERDAVETLLRAGVQPAARTPPLSEGVAERGFPVLADRIRAAEAAQALAARGHRGAPEGPTL